MAYSGRIDKISIKVDVISRFYCIFAAGTSGECGHVSEIGSLLAVPHLLRMVVIVTIGLNCIGKVFPRRNHLSPGYFLPNVLGR